MKICGVSVKYNSLQTYCTLPLLNYMNGKFSEGNSYNIFVKYYLNIKLHRYYNNYAAEKIWNGV